MSNPDITKLPVSLELVDGDTVTRTIQTYLGDISTGTAVAYATESATGTVTELPASNLKANGEVDVVFDPILTGGRLSIGYFVIEIEVVVGSVTMTVPGVEGLGALVQVRPDRGSQFPPSL